MPCYKGQPPLLTDKRPGIAYVLMTIHAQTLDFIHNLDSVIFSRPLVIPQVEPKNLLADGGKEVVVIIPSTFSVEVLVG